MYYLTMGNVYFEKPKGNKEGRQLLVAVMSPGCHNVSTEVIYDLTKKQGYGIVFCCVILFFIYLVLLWFNTEGI